MFGVSNSLMVEFGRMGEASFFGIFWLVVVGDGIVYDSSFGGRYTVRYECFFFL